MSVKQLAEEFDRLAKSTGKVAGNLGRAAKATEKIKDNLVEVDTKNASGARVPDIRPYGTNPNIPAYGQAFAGFNGATPPHQSGHLGGGGGSTHSSKFGGPRDPGSRSSTVSTGSGSGGSHSRLGADGDSSGLAPTWKGFEGESVVWNGNAWTYTGGQWVQAKPFATQGVSFLDSGPGAENPYVGYGNDSPVLPGRPSPPPPGNGGGGGGNNGDPGFKLLNRSINVGNVAIVSALERLEKKIGQDNGTEFRRRFP